MRVSSQKHINIISFCAEIFMGKSKKKNKLNRREIKVYFLSFMLGKCWDFFFYLYEYIMVPFSKSKMSMHVIFLLILLDMNRFEKRFCLFHSYCRQITVVN